MLFEPVQRKDGVPSRPRVDVADGGSSATMASFDLAPGALLAVLMRTLMHKVVTKCITKGTQKCVSRGVVIIKY